MKIDMSKLSGGQTTWKDYIETYLMGSGMIANAAIFGPDTSKSDFTLVEWASSSGLKTGANEFTLSSSELMAIWKNFNDPTDIRAKGVIINDQNYTCIRADSDLIVGRTVEGGCVLGRTKTVLVMTIFDDPFQSNCWNTVLKLITFLRDHGF